MNPPPRVIAVIFETWVPADHSLYVQLHHLITCTHLMAGPGPCSTAPCTEDLHSSWTGYLPGNSIVGRIEDHHCFARDPPLVRRTVLSRILVYSSEKAARQIPNLLKCFDKQYSLVEVRYHFSFKFSWSHGNFGRSIDSKKYVNQCVSHIQLSKSTYSS